MEYLNQFLKVQIGEGRRKEEGGGEEKRKWQGSNTGSGMGIESVV